MDNLVKIYSKEEIAERKLKSFLYEKYKNLLYQNKHSEHFRELLKNEINLNPEDKFNIERDVASRTYKLYCDSIIKNNFNYKEFLSDLRLSNKDKINIINESRLKIYYGISKSSVFDIFLKSELFSEKEKQNVLFNINLIKTPKNIQKIRKIDSLNQIGV